MNINRREFLLGLVSLGAVPLIGGFDLDIIEDIDGAWETMTNQPYIFHVCSNTIYDKSYESPKTNRDAYDIFGSIDTLDDLQDVMTDCTPFEWYVSSLYEEFRGNIGNKGEQDTWAKNYEVWSNEDKITLERWVSVYGEKVFLKNMNHELETFLNVPFSASDYGVFSNVPIDGATYVYHFFESEFAFSEMLSIDLVEGYHPGDDSQVAELNIPVADANRICTQYNIPVCFLDCEVT